MQKILSCNIEENKKQNGDILYSRNSKINCDSSNIKDILPKLNKNMFINESINLKIKLLNYSPLYYGCFIYFGFKIKSLQKSNNLITVTLIKEKEIPANLTAKKYSFLIKLPRTGKNGKRIFVYKLRTMQPYSEYIQDFVIKLNGLNEDGTIKDDFRITKFGKFARKYWLDELPMLLNWLKGDLKFIGVRPLSDTMLNQYPEEYLPFRHKYKPGLIPPYYIDKPKTFDAIIESEQNYLTRYKEKPILTDITYFIKFLKVVFKGVRSS